MNQQNSSIAEKTILLGLTEEEMCAFALTLGMPKFVGKQLHNWIYQHRVVSFSEMKNISEANRRKLDEVAIVGLHAPEVSQRSKDGTVKYLYRTLRGNYVETVYIPTSERATLCVSCQVGCKMNCQFCMTGRQTWNESLTTADILNQIFALPEYDNLSNLVFMGQGEPFDNTDHILKSLHILTDPKEMAWSPKRITVSTVGILPGLQRFLNESRCHLAISLHNPFPDERKDIMPIEKAYSITQVISLLHQYDFCLKTPHSEEATKQRRLSFEYIMFRDQNDSLQHANAIVELVKGLDCRVNLIRFHEIPDSPFHGTDLTKMEHFRDYLTHHGVFTTIRASRGEDILAACGMLSTKEQQRQAGANQ
ncbi:MAG: 23S rRNA (adenine(2503)-C(2))-methyltransferase RlmN [Alloprevotella sp.]|nr:23S rRNA (adenine(2503)-C(2))-methyltransferase RlmN [Alloprevotella sp.]